ncbi:glycosyltransferase [Iris pallida]|uniref:Glycosyltransferases n=1 Tax=Iris pallida TaxID=29817 RepID=A0AAX6G499_IRIPA|nr:glycosyltransferase [Iris pallida]KAJ6823185.1 glycosyltransferase [Iris pallida]
MKSSTRRTTTFRPSSSADPLSSSSADSLSSLFSLLFHSCCCLASLLLGFRFSRLLFLLLFSPSHPNRNPAQTLTPTPLLPNLTSPTSHVVVGRHGILIRPNPHPDPSDTARAHRILRRVQSEQRSRYGAAARSPRPVLAVTPTYSRTFQALHLTGLVHSLSLVPYPLTWIVVEAGGASNETADLLTRSKLNAIHLGFDREMPVEWSHRHRMEAEMRIRALREVRDRKLDGIVVFTDDSNMHSLELFDEIQKVKWMGAVSVGILAHSGDSNPARNDKSEEEEKDKEENLPVPVQGPACNSSDQLVGWHTFNSLPYLGKSAAFVGDGGTVLPARMEWAGFVLNSRLVWSEAEGRPDWVRDFESVGANGEEVESPLVLVKDAAFVEPLGSCGRKVMLWWLRAEARSDSKFPSRWIIDPPLEITVPAKRTPWPEAPPELPKLNTDLDHTEKRSTRTGRSSRSRHGSRSKRNHESRVNEQVPGVSQSQAQ